MSPQLNHTIAWCTDKVKSANFLAHVLGLPEPRRFFHFLVVDLSNDVSIDFYETSQPVAVQHYAFLVSEEEFDAAFERIKALEIDIWADPMLKRPGEINHNDGGRGVYFKDPDGYWIEINDAKE